MMVIVPPSRPAPKAQPKAIDMTPTWSEVLPVLLAVLEDPKAKQEGKKAAREELRRLAQWADLQMAARKASR